MTEFYGVPVSRTNAARLSTARTWLRRSGITLLSVMSLLGTIGFYRACIHPPQLDVSAIAQRTDNVHDQIGGFAADFVELWLTARNGDARAFDQFIDTQVAGPWVPHNAYTDVPAAAVATARPAAIVYQRTTHGVELYSATVSVMQRQLPAAVPQRVFYRMPVTLWRQQPRIVGWPETVDGPGPGAHVKLSYPVSIDPAKDKALYDLIVNFVTAYLTQTSSLDRYAARDSGVFPVGGYSSAQLLSVRLSWTPPASAGRTVHALVQVLARTSQQVGEQMTMALTVRNASGTWMISDLDLAPALSDDDVEPYVPAKK